MSHGLPKCDLVEDGSCQGSVSSSGRTHGKDKSRLIIRKEDRFPVLKDACGSDEDLLESQRQSLLVEKQEQLEEVLDRHDTLVREVFHMENFRMMLAFDPQEAKAENSKVFQEYKSQYDLLDRADSTPSPTRKTRRTQTERRQIIATPSISAPATLATARNLAKGAHLGEAAKSSTKLWGIITREREKGKPKPDGQKEKVREKQKEIAGVSGGDGSDERHHTAARAHRKSLSKGDAMPVSTEGWRTAQDGEAPNISAKHQRITDVPGHPVLRRRSDRQKALTSSAAATQSSHAPDDKATQQLMPSKRSATQVNGLEEPPKFKIKRIKLIVRRPPPLISHPAQRPPHPKFSSSLLAFLSSYVAPFEKFVEEAALERRIQKEAVLFERAHKLRQVGRFVPASEDATEESLVELRSSSFTPKRASKDIWDQVVESAIVYGRTRKRATGQQVAGQIAAKIKAYWDAQEAKKEKKKIITEKQLRVLARDTMRLVTNEWKKAVYHIREKERLRTEEEERRRGHEHLDAILNQSGYILRTQHGDLLRNGTTQQRSHSAGLDDLSEDGGEEEEVDEEGEGVDKESIEDEDEDEDREHTLGEEGREESIAGGSDASQMVDVDETDDEDDGFDTRMLLGESLTRDFLEQEDIPATPEERTHDIPPGHDGSSRQTSPSIATPHQTHESTDEGIQSTLTLYSEETVIEPSAQALDVVFPLSKSPRASTIPSPQLDLDLDPTLSKESGEITSATSATEAPIGASESAILEELDGAGDTRAKDSDDDDEEDSQIPLYLKPYAVTPVDWDPSTRIKPPLLLRGVLRPYQQAGLEWLASLHSNHLNGILADEMGLGKTIQTIALLAHLACDRGIWGPHLIIVPTSVLLNWEMEFKKFLPGFKILSYHGSTKRRKELRHGWNDKHHFNVCVTSYALASRDAHIFKRKPWYYMVLDEAHMIKNFKSNRWNTLLMFRSFRRLLLTGTPLQNNLTELWALLKFLMSGANFANLKEFGEWFSNPLEKAIEMGNVHDDETMQRVSKLHTVLRPYLLRRLKRDVEKELPSKYEHLVLCPLSKRQRFLYDEFMSRATTQDALQSGVYQKVANVLMQLRKVCNHPDLFEVRPIVTSFAMPRSAISDFEIKELLIRRRLLCDEEEHVNLDLLGLQFIQRQNTPLIVAMETRRLDATSQLLDIAATPREPPPKDLKTIAGYQKYAEHKRHVKMVARWDHIGYLNRHRCNFSPILSQELIATTRRLYRPIVPISATDLRYQHMDTSIHLASSVLSYEAREESMAGCINRFAVITPAAVALDLPRIVLPGYEESVTRQSFEFDRILHRASVKLQIAFPDPSLLQYDCGKLQRLAELLREKKAGGHRVLIFTQMTRILDILEIFLNFHAYLYLRLDGATKIEDRQYITERFNVDERVFCFISSSRSGGVGINLTGADTVIFYDSDFNPQMDRQCEDRAHRIGQMRDVHIYRFVSQHTVEEAMLRKANQKRSLDDLVIQKGEFDWRSLFNDESALTKALEEFEDTEDVHAAAMAAREEVVMGDADDSDFGDDGGQITQEATSSNTQEQQNDTVEEVEDELGGTTVDYMIALVEQDYDFFRDWRI